MKKILFIMHSMPIGGAEKVLVDILDNFDYLQYELHLLLYVNEGEMLSKINRNVKQMFLFRPSKRNLYTRIKSKCIQVFRLVSKRERYYTNKVVKEKYDCIVSFCQGPAHKIHTFLLKQAPLHLSWIHSDLSKENWGKLFFDNDLKKQEAAYNLMNRLIFVSNGAKDAFNNVFKVSPSIEQEIIYNFVDISSIQSHSLDFIVEKPQDRFLFVNSGRLVSQKKQIRLIEVADILRREDYEFEIWILGDGPLQKFLLDKINEYDIADYVKLLGSKSNPYPYVKAADAFVLSSSQEGFPIVVCEALALGKPVVATKVVGPIEMLGANSEYGLLVDESIDSIAEGMRKFMQNANIRNYYSKRSLERSTILKKNKAMSEIYNALER